MRWNLSWRKKYFCLFTNFTMHQQLTNSVEESPSLKATSVSSRQEITRALWSPKVHYRVYSSPPIVPMLSQMHSLQARASCFVKIHFNIIRPSTHIHSCYFPPGFHMKAISPFLFTIPYYVHCPSHPAWLIDKFQLNSAAFCLMGTYVAVIELFVTYRRTDGQRF
jgi:hypothetical protein